MGCAKRFALWERKSRRTAEKARTTGDDAAYSSDNIFDITSGTFNKADCNASVGGENMKLFKKLPTIERWIEELRRTEMDPNLRGELIEKSINMYIDRELGIAKRFCAIAVGVTILLPLLIILVHLVRR